jgi:hypothetical protein
MSLHTLPIGKPKSNVRGNTVGRPFDTKVDALMGGYGAARGIVDDLFDQKPH